MQRSFDTVKDPVWLEQLQAAIKTPDLPDWNLMYYDNRLAIQEMIRDVWVRKYTFRTSVSFRFPRVSCTRPLSQSSFAIDKAQKEPPPGRKSTACEECPATCQTTQIESKAE